MKRNPLQKERGLAEASLPTPTASLKLMMLLLISIILTLGCHKADFTSNKATTEEENAKASPTFNLKLVADKFVSPVTVVAPNDGSKRLFVVDQIGKVWIIFPDGSKSLNPFIDVSSKIVQLTPAYDERGLLGLAFHPDFKNNGKFYLYYSAPPRPGGPEPGIPWNNTSTLAEFKASAGNPNKANLSSEKVLLRVNHPQSNHNGGTIAFGPTDGYLYLSIGDGGAADDTGAGHVEDWYKVNAGGNGQDVIHNLLGNILRIDVNSTTGTKAYGIPPDNPFVGTPGRDEIYAFGFRNPYRFSFDMAGNHSLFAGDAGQSLYEEIDDVQKGGNYGWNVKEGTHCFNTDNDLTVRAACPNVDSAGNPLIDPIIEMENSDNPDGKGLTIAIVGGNVYRGSSIPSLYGKYIFGALSADEDKPEGKVYMAQPGIGPGLLPFQQVQLQSFPQDLGQWLKGFGQDQDGEIYITATKQLGPQGTSGKVWKLVSTNK